MASENLNRVFIKAYGKGKATGSNSIPSAEPKDNQDAWIVRFDTATVQTAVVPQMHNQRPPLHESELAIPGRSPTPNANQQTHAMHAYQSEWYPFGTTQVPTMAPGLMSAVSGLPKYEGDLSHYGDLSQYIGGSMMVVPQATLGNPVEREKPRSAPPVDEGTMAPATDPLSPATLNSSTGNRQADASRPTEPFNDRLDNVSPQTIEPWELEQRIAAKNKSGEIFRLDRPSYASEQKAMDIFADDQPSCPSEVSSLTSIADQDDSVAQSPTLPQGTMKGPSRTFTTSPTPDSLNKQAITKERDLRQARLRIFNPLWEVDRLEWPQVCVELLSLIDEKSPGVASNLLNACQEGLQVLAVTSPQSGTGTSTVACCLAMIAGRHGLNIALVDGNMENPSLCYQTNLELEVDWHEALARSLPLEEIAVHSVDDQVTLVPLLARLSAPQLNEQNMAKMLSELSESFDLVVVDLGHMATTRNMVTTLGELGAINAVVAVVDRRNSSADRIESCLRQIRQTGIASIGLVENFAA